MIEKYSIFEFWEKTAQNQLFIKICCLLLEVSIPFSAPIIMSPPIIMSANILSAQKKSDKVVTIVTFYVDSHTYCTSGNDDTHFSVRVLHIGHNFILKFLIAF